ncbi:hypothetical protein [Nocardioides aquiterrae]|uniref:DUF1850 domain-containing protein n=1 Tax=Nocardioides aquiterrae TaxID=203799 RepID=A0ABN1UAB9_9ACTN
MQTIDGLETREQGALAVWSRRGYLVLLLVVVAAGLAGLLGVRTVTDSADEADWSMTFTHAGVARAGLDVPWRVTVRHPGGFGKELTLALTADYLDIYEEQGFRPEPAETTRDGDTLFLTFTAPLGDTFVLDFDAYIQPSAQRGRGGTLSVMDDGARVATVDFDTRLLP